jgi:hypothetical protein
MCITVDMCYWCSGDEQCKLAGVVSLPVWRFARVSYLSIVLLRQSLNVRYQ